MDSKDVLNENLENRCVEGIKIEDINDYLENLKRKEKGVIDKYINNFNLTNEEADWLYKFFDPNPIVVGLTEEEVRLCLFFYPLREQQKSLYSFPLYPPMVHKSLRNNPNENISRTEGLKNTIYEIVFDLMRKKSSINP